MSRTIVLCRASYDTVLSDDDSQGVSRRRFVVSGNLLSYTKQALPFRCVRVCVCDSEYGVRESILRGSSSIAQSPILYMLIIAFRYSTVCTPVRCTLILYRHPLSFNRKNIENKKNILSGLITVSR